MSDDVTRQKKQMIKLSLRLKYFLLTYNNSSGVLPGDHLNGRSEWPKCCICAESSLSRCAQSSLFRNAGISTQEQHCAGLWWATVGPLVAYWFTCFVADETCGICVIITDHISARTALWMASQTREQSRSRVWHSCNALLKTSYFSMHVIQLVVHAFVYIQHMFQTK